MSMTTTAEKTMQRILVVDDESSISELISTSLRFVGFDVRTAANGAQALVMAEEFKPHAMVLDVMLPDLDGFEVCRAIRNEGISTGVLFLTAKDGMEDKVKGLTLGGAGTRCLRKVTVDVNDPDLYAVTLLLAERRWDIRMKDNDRALAKCELHAMRTDANSFRETECLRQPCSGLKYIRIPEFRNKCAGRHGSIV